MLSEQVDMVKTYSCTALSGCSVVAIMAIYMFFIAVITHHAVTQHIYFLAPMQTI